MPPLLTNSNASCTSEKLTGIVPPQSICSRTWIGRPAFEASPARRTVKPALVIVKTRFWLPGRFLSRRFPGGLEKVLSSTGDRGFESTSLQRRVQCEPDTDDDFLAAGGAVLAE